ncbi:hypothetical protein [Arundinibacter roseus]|uniref:Lipocalin-like domain-containing protein n=1 Tax=Arundinibacter roseus TaxID=2070510 RepID=A0A4R4KGB1_9BACT|nr:hypothetical protein [Arundinibacter roseus]TDB65896.1 hypothetical protein EZE20_09010 [Arundinibacter roseus]
MKKLLVLFLIVFAAGCKDKEPEPEPNYAADFVGEYWTNTADGGNSTAQTWVITESNNLLNITYTIDYTFRNQGKELRSKEVYTLKDIQVLNPVSFKIAQDAAVNEDGNLKTRRVEGEGVKSTKADGTVVIGITLKFTEPGASSSTSTDYLEFKKR